MKTLQTITSIIILALLITVSSCNDNSEDPDVIQLLINSSVEAGSSSPNKWFVGPVGDYQTSWTSEHSFTGSKSLMIASNNDIGQFTYWFQRIVENIPHGRRLKLSSMIKLDQVDPNSEGVAIAVRGDDEDQNSVFFFTTQGDIPIRGDEDWQEFYVEMKSTIAEDVSTIYVFLILSDDTFGTVYFDDIKLETIN